jgi:hypothetical protein
MTPNTDNRKRAFADVVSIDAWHNEFTDEHSKVDLHADVVFGSARIGGELKSPVRFRLAVRCAEIVVIIPESEPVSVDRNSVSRDAPEYQGKLTEVVEQTAQGSMKGNVKGSISPTELTAAASAEAAGQASISSTKKLEVSATVQFMFVTQSTTEEGYYRWAVKARSGKDLEGRPWDGAKQPRLKLIDKRKDHTKGIPPTVRVEVRCRREDLIIEDIRVKDEGLWADVKSRVGFKNKLLAAESYIRDRLAEEGIVVHNIGEIFSQITLGSVIADTTN